MAIKAWRTASPPEFRQRRGRGCALPCRNRNSEPADARMNALCHPLPEFARCSGSRGPKPARRAVESIGLTIRHLAQFGAAATLSLRPW
jgi:hypothetical protein